MSLRLIGQPQRGVVDRYEVVGATACCPRSRAAMFAGSYRTEDPEVLTAR